jgi:hypothetical protein
MTDTPTSAHQTEAEDKAVFPPPYDPDAVGRVASRAAIDAVDLLGLIFRRRDDGPLDAAPDELPDQMGLDVEWEVDRENMVLGCAVSCGALFEDSAPYDLRARFGLRYLLSDLDGVSDEDLDQFAHWNAVFNAWPFWREIVANTTARAGLPQVVVPVLGLPRQLADAIGGDA